MVVMMFLSLNIHAETLDKYAMHECVTQSVSIEEIEQNLDDREKRLKKMSHDISRLSVTLIEVEGEHQIVLRNLDECLIQYDDTRVCYLQTIGVEVLADRYEDTVRELLSTGYEYNIKVEKFNRDVKRLNHNYRSYEDRCYGKTYNSEHIDSVCEEYPNTDFCKLAKGY